MLKSKGWILAGNGTPSQVNIFWTIDVSALPAGIYLAVVKDKKGMVGSAKFVVGK